MLVDPSSPTPRILPIKAFSWNRFFVDFISLLQTPYVGLMKLALNQFCWRLTLCYVYDRSSCYTHTVNAMCPRTQVCDISSTIKTPAVFKGHWKLEPQTARPSFSIGRGRRVEIIISAWSSCSGEITRSIVLPPLKRISWVVRRFQLPNSSHNVKTSPVWTVGKTRDEDATDMLLIFHKTGWGPTGSPETSVNVREHSIWRTFTLG